MTLKKGTTGAAKCKMIYAAFLFLGDYKHTDEPDLASSVTIVLIYIIHCIFRLAFCLKSGAMFLFITTKTFFINLIG